MYANYTTVRINDEPAARRLLSDEVVPMVSGAPGFVAGYWLAPQKCRDERLLVAQADEASRARPQRRLEGQPGQRRRLAVDLDPRPGAARNDLDLPAPLDAGDQRGDGPAVRRERRQDRSRRRRRDHGPVRGERVGRRAQRRGQDQAVAGPPRVE